MKNDKKIDVVPAGKKISYLSFIKRYQRDLQLH